MVINYGRCNRSNNWNGPDGNGSSNPRKDDGHGVPKAQGPLKEKEVSHKWSTLKPLCGWLN